MLNRPGELITPGEVKKAKSNLGQVFNILNTDARAEQHMMCQRAGETLNFYTLFGTAEAARSACVELVRAGQQPTLDGQKVFLTARFPEAEINELAAKFNSIPGRE